MRFTSPRHGEGLLSEAYRNSVLMKYYWFFADLCFKESFSQSNEKQIRMIEALDNNDFSVRTSGRLD